MGTAERRIKLIRLLCRRRHETISNLASEFGVSAKTIQRDINEISDIIPVYTKTGRYEGGIYVINGFNLDRMYMSENELILLNKIKIFFLNDKKYFLSYNEIQLLSNIICTYTVPKKKI